MEYKLVPVGIDSFGIFKNFNVFCSRDRLSLMSAIKRGSLSRYPSSYIGIQRTHSPLAPRVTYTVWSAPTNTEMVNYLWFGCFLSKMQHQELLVKLWQFGFLTTAGIFFSSFFFLFFLFPYLFTPRYYLLTKLNIDFVLVVGLMKTIGWRFKFVSWHKPCSKRYLTSDLVRFIQIDYWTWYLNWHLPTETRKVRNARSLPLVCDIKNFLSESNNHRC